MKIFIICASVIGLMVLANIAASLDQISKCITEQGISSEGQQ